MGVTRRAPRPAVRAPVLQSRGRPRVDLPNVFARLGASKRIHRIDRPDFEIISDEQYQRLRRCARVSHTDSYGLILEGTILAIGEAAMRPGEIFALHYSDVDFSAGVIHVCRQLDMASGVID